MKTPFGMAVFTVTQHNGQWAVEHDGRYTGHSVDKEMARAAASKQARDAHSLGRLCVIRVTGESGYFAAPR